MWVSRARWRARVAPRSGARLARALLCAVGLAGAIPLAREVPVARAAETAAPHLVTLETRGEIDPELEPTLRELLARQGLDLARAGGGGGGDVDPARVVAHVRVDVTSSGAHVAVVDPSNRVPPAQRDVPAGGSSALFRETLAHAVLAAVDPFVVAARSAPPAPSASSGAASALPAPSAAAPTSAPSASASPVASAAPVASSPPPAAPAQPSARPPPPVLAASPAPAESTGHPAPLSISLGAGAGARWVASDQAGAFVQGGAALTHESRLRPAIAIDAGYMLPVRASDGPVAGRLTLLATRAHARLEPLRWRWLSLETGVGAGVDVLSLSPSSDDPAVRVGDTSTRAEPVVGVSLAPRARAGPNVDLVLTLGLDLDLGPHRWVVDEGGARSALLETARVRPYLAVGIDWIAAGAAHAPSAETER